MIGYLRRGLIGFKACMMNILCFGAPAFSFAIYIWCLEFIYNTRVQYQLRSYVSI